MEGPTYVQDGHEIPTIHSQGTSNVARSVEAIFRLAPPMLHGPKAGSDSTREPAFYDMHLSEDLLLKRVLFSRNFTEQLGNIASAALRQATLPPEKGTGWTPTAFLNSTRLNKSSGVVAEQDVVTSYRAKVYENIAGIASALEFPSSSWESQFIDMHSSDPKELFTGADPRLRHNYALADGILILNPCKHARNVPKDSEMVQDIETVVKYFKRIVPFEFKSLISGSYDTMLCILQHTLAETFPWERCSSTYCAHEHAPQLGRKPVTGDPLGFDAVFPGVVLEASIWEGKKKKATTRGEKNLGHGKNTLQQKKKATTREIGHGKNTLQQKKKVTTRGEKNLVHGKNMLQQIWSQMVKYDTTFAVLQAGTHELIFARDRKNQFLYVSDLIEPQKIGQENPREPGYYQIHIGLYIAAIRDAVDRAKRLKEFEDLNGSLPTHWTRPFDCGYGIYRPAPTLKPQLRDVVSTYPSLCIAWHKDNDSPPTFVKHRPYYRNGKKAMRFFFLEAREFAEPNVHIGSLVYREHKFVEIPVVIRTAAGQKAIQELFFEYLRHKKLSAKENLMVQQPYGFFSMGGVGGDYAVLLLQYVGTRIASLRDLSDYQRTSIQNTLRNLHKLKFLHGLIRPGNIYLDDTLEGRKRHGQKAAFPWLVDLSQVRKELDRTKHKLERAKLRNLVKRAEKGERPSHLVLLGPFSEFIADPQDEFMTRTHWMGQNAWIAQARCSTLVTPDGDIFLQVKFISSEHACLFMKKWDSRNLPLEIGCTSADFLTSFQSSSRACSEALSPESSQDVMERNAQPMVIE